MRRRLLIWLTIGVLTLPIASLLFNRELLVSSLLVMFFVHAVTALATFVPGSQIWGPARRRFAAIDDVVWLTIDDGPASDTDMFLETLRRRDARATFFVIGERAAGHPGHVRRMHEEGHEIACHTWSHPAGWFWAYAPGAIRRELKRCNEVIESETGVPVRRFRPPVGFRNGWTHDVLEDLSMELVSWSRRGLDGIETGDPQKVVQRIVDGVQPGDILMIHQGRPSSVAILDHLLEELQRRSLRCVIPE